MLATPTIAANLLIPESLEALLLRSSGRMDLTARLHKLHAAALMECALKGHAGLKMTDVAIRAKVSTASIYKTYKDRDALLVAAMETLFAILADDIIEVPQIRDPIKCVEYLLIAHGEVYAQPLSTWLFRLYASLASSGYTGLRQNGSYVFQGIDAFWHGFLRNLIDQGHLRELNPEDVVPQLLGPIERCTIVWQLGCGDGENREQVLVEAAQYSAQTLFSLYGRSTSGLRQIVTSRGLNEIAISPITANLSVASSDTALAAVATRLNGKLVSQPKSTTSNETKDRLLLAAAVVCQEFGYHKASMQKVAARAKVSTATLYKLFKDKADLFSAALEREFKLRVSFEDVSLPEEELEAQLSRALFAIAARAKSPDWIWMYDLMMASEISGTPRLTSLARELRSEAEAFLKSVLVSFAKPHPSNITLTDTEIALITNFTLGLVERYGVFSLILFGEQACDLKELKRLSAVAAHTYTELLAT
jgi:AcrR family transcriptional regulator